MREMLISGFGGFKALAGKASGLAKPTWDAVGSWLRSCKVYYKPLADVAGNIAAGLYLSYLLQCSSCPHQHRGKITLLARIVLSRKRHCRMSLTKSAASRAGSLHPQGVAKGLRRTTVAGQHRTAAPATHSNKLVTHKLI